MDKSTKLSKIVAKLLKVYLIIVYMTSKVSIKGEENWRRANNVIGFWHGDSFAMYLLLKKLVCREGHIFTTVDSRGDYVNNLAINHGLEPVRLPNDLSGGKFAGRIKDVVKSKGNLFATLDGPLGPLHIPKELTFKVAMLKKATFTSVGLKTTSVAILKGRWDKYKIPLPFGRYEFTVNRPITVSREDFKEFYKLGDKVREEING